MENKEEQIIQYNGNDIVSMIELLDGLEVKGIKNVNIIMSIIKILNLGKKIPVTNNQNKSNVEKKD